MRVSIEPAGPLVRLILSRAERQNALDHQSIRELRAALDTAVDTGGSILVLESALARVFSTGLDFDALSEAEAPGDAEDYFAAIAEEYCGLLARLLSLPIPTVGIVDGFAVGGGVDLLACCDLVLATENACASVNQLRRGMFPYTTSAVLVPRIGHGAFFEWLLSGVNLPARRLATIGLASRVDSREAIERFVIQLGDRAAAFDPIAMHDGMMFRRNLTRGQTEQALVDAVPYLCRNLCRLHSARSPA